MDEKVKAAYLADLDYFQDLYSKNPSSTYCLPVALIYSRLERYDDVLQMTATGLDVYPNFTQLEVLRADALINLGRKAEALDLLYDAVTMDPDNYLALKLLGLIYKNDDRRDDAIKYLRAAYLKAPEDIDLSKWLDEYGVLSTILDTNIVTESSKPTVREEDESYLDNIKDKVTTAHSVVEDITRDINAYKLAGKTAEQLIIDSAKDPSQQVQPKTNTDKSLEGSSTASISEPTDSEIGLPTLSDSELSKESSSQKEPDSQLTLEPDHENNLSPDDISPAEPIPSADVSSANIPGEMSISSSDVGDDKELDSQLTLEPDHENNLSPDDISPAEPIPSADVSSANIPGEMSISSSDVGDDKELDSQLILEPDHENNLGDTTYQAVESTSNSDNVKIHNSNVSVDSAAYDSSLSYKLPDKDNTSPKDNVVASTSESDIVKEDLTASDTDQVIDVISNTNKDIISDNSFELKDNNTKDGTGNNSLAGDNAADKTDQVVLDKDGVSNISAGLEGNRKTIENNYVSSDLFIDDENDNINNLLDNVSDWYESDTKHTDAKVYDSIDTVAGITADKSNKNGSTTQHIADEDNFLFGKGQTDIDNINSENPTDTSNDLSVKNSITQTTENSLDNIHSEDKNIKPDISNELSITTSVKNNEIETEEPRLVDNGVISDSNTTNVTAGSSITESIAGSTFNGASGSNKIEVVKSLEDSKSVASGTLYTNDNDKLNIAGHTSDIDNNNLNHSSNESTLENNDDRLGSENITPENKFQDLNKDGSILADNSVNTKSNLLQDTLKHDEQKLGIDSDLSIDSQGLFKQSEQALTEEVKLEDEKVDEIDFSGLFDPVIEYMPSNTDEQQKLVESTINQTNNNHDAENNDYSDVKDNRITTSSSSKESFDLSTDQSKISGQSYSDLMAGQSTDNGLSQTDDVQLLEGFEPLKDTFELFNTYEDIKDEPAGDYGVFNDKVNEETMVELGNEVYSAGLIEDSDTNTKETESAAGKNLVLSGNKDFEITRDINQNNQTSSNSETTDVSSTIQSENISDPDEKFFIDKNVFMGSRVNKSSMFMDDQTLSSTINNFIESEHLNVDIQPSRLKNQESIDRAIDADNKDEEARRNALKNLTVIPEFDELIKGGNSFENKPIDTLTYNDEEAYTTLHSMAHIPEPSVDYKPVDNTYKGDAEKALQNMIMQPSSEEVIIRDKDQNTQVDMESYLARNAKVPVLDDEQDPNQKGSSELNPDKTPFIPENLVSDVFSHSGVAPDEIYNDQERITPDSLKKE